MVALMRIVRFFSWLSEEALSPPPWRFSRVAGGRPPTLNMAGVCDNEMELMEHFCIFHYVYAVSILAQKKPPV